MSAPGFCAHLSSVAGWCFLSPSTRVPPPRLPVYVSLSLCVSLPLIHERKINPLTSHHKQPSPKG